MSSGKQLPEGKDLSMTMVKYRENFQSGQPGGKRHVSHDIEQSFLL